MASIQEPESFYENQTVFLAGGTGGLGTCLLYKLSIELPTKKIYVLVRSVDKALRGWGNTIPDQLDAILNSGKIVLVTGSLLDDNLGIEESILREIQHETTVVINTAANTSWTTTLSKAVADNCTTALNMATVATTFPKLKHIVYVSSVYANAFLPEKSVAETIHSIYDPEVELQTISTTGTSPHASKFPWPYAHSKHLAEQLLLSRFPNLPLLIARPGGIASAVRSPYMGYGPVKSVPGEMFWRMWTLNAGNGYFYPAHGSKTGTNILDDTPVDWIANVILLHATRGTRGVVHTASGTFKQQTLDEFMALYAIESDPKAVWITDRTIKQSFVPDFYKVFSGDWRFETGRSDWCKSVKGPLSTDVKTVDLAVYNAARKSKVRRDIAVVLERRRAKKEEATMALMCDTLRGRDDPLGAFKAKL